MKTQLVFHNHTRAVSKLPTSNQSFVLVVFGLLIVIVIVAIVFVLLFAEFAVLLFAAISFAFGVARGRGAGGGDEGAEPKWIQPDPDGRHDGVPCRVDHRHGPVGAIAD